MDGFTYVKSKKEKEQNKKEKKQEKLQEMAIVSRQYDRENKALRVHPEEMEVKAKHVEGCCLTRPSKGNVSVYNVIMNSGKDLSALVERKSECLFNDWLCLMESTPNNCSQSKNIAASFFNLRHNWFIADFYRQNIIFLNSKGIFKNSLIERPLHDFYDTDSNLTPDLVLPSENLWLEFTVNSNLALFEKNKGEEGGSKYKNIAKALNCKDIYLPIVLFELTVEENQEILNQALSGTGLKYDCSILRSQLALLTETLKGCGHEIVMEDQSFLVDNHVLLEEKKKWVNNTWAFTKKEDSKYGVLKKHSFKLKKYLVDQAEGKYSLNFTKDNVVVVSDQHGYSKEELSIILEEASQLEHLEFEDKYNMYRSTDTIPAYELSRLTPKYGEKRAEYYQHEGHAKIQKLSEIYRVDQRVKKIVRNEKYKTNVEHYYAADFEYMNSLPIDAKAVLDKYIAFSKKEENLVNTLGQLKHPDKAILQSEFEGKLAVENSANTIDKISKAKATFLIPIAVEQNGPDDMDKFIEVATNLLNHVTCDTKSNNKLNWTNVLNKSLNQLNGDKVTVDIRTLPNAVPGAISLKEDWEQLKLVNNKIRSVTRAGKVDELPILTEERKALDTKVRFKHKAIIRWYRNSGKILPPALYKLQGIDDIIKMELSRSYKSKGYQGTGNKNFKTGQVWQLQDLNLLFKDFLDNYTQPTSVSNRLVKPIFYAEHIKQERGNNVISSFKNNVKKFISVINSYLHSTDLNESLTIASEIARTLYLNSHRNMGKDQILIKRIGSSCVLIMAGGKPFKDQTRPFRLVYKTRSNYADIITCHGQSSTKALQYCSGFDLVCTPWMRLEEPTVEHMFYLKNKIYLNIYAFLEESNLLFGSTVNSLASAKNLINSHLHLVILAGLNARRNCEKKLHNIRILIVNSKSYLADYKKNIETVLSYAMDYFDYYIQNYSVTVACNFICKSQTTLICPLYGVTSSNVRLWAFLFYSSRVMPKAPFNKNNEILADCKSALEGFSICQVNSEYQAAQHTRCDPANKEEKKNDLEFDKELCILIGYLIQGVLQEAQVTGKIIEAIKDNNNKNVRMIANNRGSVIDPTFPTVTDSLEDYLKKSTCEVAKLQILGNKQYDMTTAVYQRSGYTTMVYPFIEFIDESNSDIEKIQKLPNKMNDKSLAELNRQLLGQIVAKEFQPRKTFTHIKKKKTTSELVKKILKTLGMVNRLTEEELKEYDDFSLRETGFKVKDYLTQALKEERKKEQILANLPEQEKVTGFKGSETFHLAFGAFNESLIEKIKGSNHYAAAKAMEKDCTTLYAQAILRIEDKTQLIFKVSAKKQWGGSREIYSMSVYTKTIQQIFEPIFAAICQYVPNEIITISSSQRPAFLHRLFHSNFGLNMTLDNRRWGPHSNFEKYRYLVRGMHNILPPSFTHYFELFCDQMQNKRIMIMRSEFVKICNDPIFFELIKQQDILFFSDFVLIRHPHSFMMGIFNALSSLLHAGCQLLVNTIIQSPDYDSESDKVSSVLSLAHSDDAAGVIVGGSTEKKLKAASVYEIVQDNCNHMASVKKCNLDFSGAEIISIVRQKNEVVPMYAKNISGFVPECTKRGFAADMKSTKSKIIDMISNGSSFSMAYVFSLMMSYTIGHEIYHLGNCVLNRPFELLGNPDIDPVTMLILGSYYDHYRPGITLEELCKSIKVTDELSTKSYMSRRRILNYDLSVNWLLQLNTNNPEYCNKLVGSTTLKSNKFPSDTLLYLQHIARLRDPEFSDSLDASINVGTTNYSLRNNIGSCYKYNGIPEMAHVYRELLNTEYDFLMSAEERPTEAFMKYLANEHRLYSSYQNWPALAFQEELTTKIKPVHLSVQPPNDSRLNLVPQAKIETYYNEKEFANLIFLTPVQKQILSDNEPYFVKMTALEQKLCLQSMNSTSMSRLNAYAVVPGDEKQVRDSRSLVSYISHNLFRNRVLTRHESLNFRIYRQSETSMFNNTVINMISNMFSRRYIKQSVANEFFDKYKVVFEGQDYTVNELITKFENSDSAQDRSLAESLKAKRGETSSIDKIPYYIWVNPQKQSGEEFTGFGKLLYVRENCLVEIKVLGMKVNYINYNISTTPADLEKIRQDLISMGYNDIFANKIPCAKPIKEEGPIFKDFFSDLFYFGHRETGSITVTNIFLNNYMLYDPKIVATLSDTNRAKIKVYGKEYMAHNSLDVMNQSINPAVFHVASNLEVMKEYRVGNYYLDYTQATHMKLTEQPNVDNMHLFGLEFLYETIPDYPHELNVPAGKLSIVGLNRGWAEVLSQRGLLRLPPLQHSEATYLAANRLATYAPNFNIYLLERQGIKRIKASDSVLTSALLQNMKGVGKELINIGDPTVKEHFVYNIKPGNCNTITIVLTLEVYQIIHMSYNSDYSLRVLDSAQIYSTNSAGAMPGPCGDYSEQEDGMLLGYTADDIRRAQFLIKTSHFKLMSMIEHIENTQNKAFSVLFSSYGLTNIKSTHLAYILAVHGYNRLYLVDQQFEEHWANISSDMPGAKAYMREKHFGWEKFTYNYMLNQTYDTIIPRIPQSVSEFCQTGILKANRELGATRRAEMVKREEVVSMIKSINEEIFGKLSQKTKKKLAKSDYVLVSLKNNNILVNENLQQILENQGIVYKMQIKKLKEMHNSNIESQKRMKETYMNSRYTDQVYAKLDWDGDKPGLRDHSKKATFEVKAEKMMIISRADTKDDEDFGQSFYYVLNDGNFDLNYDEGNFECTEENTALRKSKKMYLHETPKFETFEAALAQYCITDTDEFFYTSVNNNIPLYYKVPKGLNLYIYGTFFCLTNTVQENALKLLTADEVNGFRMLNFGRFDQNYNPTDENLGDMGSEIMQAKNALSINHKAVLAKQALKEICKMVETGTEDDTQVDPSTINKPETKIALTEILGGNLKTALSAKLVLSREKCINLQKTLGQQWAALVDKEHKLKKRFMEEYRNTMGLQEAWDSMDEEDRKPFLSLYNSGTLQMYSPGQCNDLLTKKRRVEIQLRNKSINQDKAQKEIDKIDKILASIPLEYHRLDKALLLLKNSITLHINSSKIVSKNGEHDYTLDSLFDYFVSMVVEKDSDTPIEVEQQETEPENFMLYYSHNQLASGVAYFHVPTESDINFAKEQGQHVQTYTIENIGKSFSQATYKSKTKIEKSKEADKDEELQEEIIFDEIE